MRNVLIISTMSTNLLRTASKFLVFSVAVLLLGQAAKTEVTQTERLAEAAKLWAKVRYFHPWLAYKDIDWDSAWVKAYPKLKAANGPAEYKSAVDAMLNVLADPATRTIAPKVHQEATDSITSNMDSNFLLKITIPNIRDLDEAIDGIKAAAKDFGKARVIIFDLRNMGETPTEYIFSQSRIDNLLTTKPAMLPGLRARMHSGFNSSPNSGGYYSAFEVKDSVVISPRPRVKDGPINPVGPVIFVVTPKSTPPLIALALQGMGSGWIISEGKLTDEAFVNSSEVTLPYGIKAKIRIEELVYPDGGTGVASDIVTRPGEGMAAALEIAKAPPTRQLPARERLPFTATTRLPKYSLPDFPGAGERTLAVVQIWSVFHYFYPYKNLMGEDWDKIMAQALSTVESAGNALEFHTAIAEMTTHVHDSHTSAYSDTLAKFVNGATFPPLEVRWIEGKPVIVYVANEEGRNAGFHPGDTILKIDGHDVQSRIDQLSRTTPASTPQALMRSICLRLLAGPDGSQIRVQVRTVRGEVLEATVTRKTGIYQLLNPPRPGDVTRVLPGNIGYVDLNRLTEAEVGGMFEKLKDTGAIIFDMRGYPKGTAWAIAPRLTERRRPIGSTIGRQVLTSRTDLEEDAETTYLRFDGAIPATEKWRYLKPTYMLIDEYTQSQAEHTGLFFEAANGTKFIGTPTAGANGDVIYFEVPGNLYIYMGGNEIRHADGRQLQRVGLQPDVPVAPTIQGVASGKDEILDRALSFVRTGK